MSLSGAINIGILWLALCSTAFTQDAFRFFFFFNIHSLSSAAISIRRKEEGHSTAVYRGMLNIFTMQLHLTHLRFIDNLYGLSSSLQRQGNVNLKSLVENKNERQVAGRNE